MPGRSQVVLTLVIAAGLVSGCTSTPEPTQPEPITVGLPGAAGWQGQGELVHDDSLRRKISGLLAAWTPPGRKLGELAATSLLWAGRVDGSVLAVSVVQLNHDGAPFIVEASGSDQDHLSITSVSPYGVAFIGSEDFFAVRSSCCARRYVVSPRVAGISVNGGPQLAIKDGLSDHAAVPRCAPASVEVSKKQDPISYRIDLGVGVDNSTSSLIFGGPPPANAEILDVLRGLDTCASSSQVSGMIKTAVTANHSSTVTGISVEPSRQVTLSSAGQGELTQLTWTTSKSGGTTSIVWRPAGGGPPAFSTSDARGKIEVFGLDLPSGAVTVLLWPQDNGNRLVLPAGVTSLVDSPGLTVLRPTPGADREVKLMSGDRVIDRRVL